MGKSKFEDVRDSGMHADRREHVERKTRVGSGRGRGTGSAWIDRWGRIDSSQLLVGRGCAKATEAERSSLSDGWIDKVHRGFVIPDPVRGSELDVARFLGVNQFLRREWHEVSSTSKAP